MRPWHAIAYKVPYVFDFLGLDEDARERALEDALTEHLTRFMFELGKGFAFVGRQYHLELGEQDFYIDLLFYHFVIGRHLSPRAMDFLATALRTPSVYLAGIVVLHFDL